MKPPRFSYISLCSLLIASYAAQAAVPTVSREQDHRYCVDKGFFLGKMEDPSTEQYYRCRAERVLAQRVPVKSTLTSLTAEEAKHNKQMQAEAEEFTAKANAAKQAGLQVSRSSMQEWEGKQSTLTKQYDEKDHKTCVAKEGEPTDWGNPDTERYYVCRAALVEQRAGPAPISTKLHESKTPEAAMYFYRKAKEAQYAYRAIDYETHHLCVERGTAPAEPENPKTEAYYRCRAELSDGRQGPKMKQMFLRRAEAAKQEALEHQPCIMKGLQKNTPAYKQCREAMKGYKGCKSAIDAKMASRKSQDAAECQKAATLQFPNHLTESREKKVVTLDQYNQVTTTITKESSLYTKAQLKEAREQAIRLCMMQKDEIQQQYYTTMRLECANLMNAESVKE